MTTLLASSVTTFASVPVIRSSSGGRLVAVVGDDLGQVADFWSQWLRLPLGDACARPEHGTPCSQAFAAHVLPQAARVCIPAASELRRIAGLRGIVDTRRILVAVPMRRPELSMAFIDEIVIAYRGRLLKRLHPEDYPLACA